MKTRRSALNGDENPSKRQRRVEVAAVSNGFASLNDDCLLNILSRLSFGDLNNVALVNRRLSVIRNHESLDQTREAVITCSSGNRPTFRSLGEALNRASRTLTPNYTKFMFLGLESVSENNYYYSDVRQLRNVTCLELGQNPTDSEASLSSFAGGVRKIVLSFFPNMQEAVLKDERYESIFFGNNRLTGRLTHIEYSGGRRNVAIYGSNFPNSALLTDLIMDRSSFVYYVYMDTTNEQAYERRMRSVEESFSNMNHPEQNYVLQFCKSLERLSIKRATWGLMQSDDQDDDVPHAEPLSQEMLMKMVRNLPNLRWLRSDLSPENIAILQQERPEITFVSE